MKPLFAVLLFLLGLAGCGESGPPLYHASGKVTHNGQPVPAGRIDFEPDTKQGNSGPGGFAVIRNGQYSTSSGRKVVAGPLIVRITGSDGIPLETETGETDPSGKPLFPEYTTGIEMPQENASFDFEVPSQKTTAESPAS